MVGRVVMLVLTVAVLSATGARATVTTSDPNGTVVLDGRKIFPIVLAKGPPPNATTPDGRDAFTEVVAAGVNFFKVGPATVPWTAADIDEAKLENRTASVHGAYTWINLSTVSLAANDGLLEQVVTALKADPAGTAIGMWKGRDEPLWSGIPAADLQPAYCRATGRSDPTWCGGRPVLDRDHLWSTIQAPRGTREQLLPYASVTDVHGVDVYPVTAASPNADLGQVGTWTSTIGSVTPNRSVWTTVQICASGSVRGDGTFILPTRAQERFMIYDAIVNGTRSLAFYGGNLPGCWNATDTAYGWSWTFWNDVLKSLVGEISAISPLAPALVETATTQVLPASDPTTEVISRAGNAGDLWVIAARRGAGTQQVTIGGLPASATSGTVYTEGRAVTAANGSFTDAFDQWGVHVYHFVPPAPPPSPAPPAVSSFAPASGPPATRVTITGANLAGATAVSFAGAAAGFTVVSSTEVAATVPGGATSGPIVVSTAGGTATSATAFTVTAPVAPPPPPPPPPGGGGSGGQAVAPDLRLAIGARSASTPLGGTADLEVTAVDAGGGASGVTLTISLPPGLALVGPPAYERGSGCTGGATLVCDLDFLTPNVPTRVLFSVRTTAAGEQRIAVGVASRETDANPVDNSAVLTIVVESPVPASRPATRASPARATQGPDRLVGTSRPDSLRGLGGADTLIGLGGNDVLDGGSGNDTLIGGAGRDALFGRAGNDVLSVRDRARDRVVCGAGRDRVIADRADVVARDCERVVRR